MSNTKGCGSTRHPSRQRASESAGSLVFSRIYIPSVVLNLDVEKVYSLWARALSPPRDCSGAVYTVLLLASS